MRLDRARGQTVDHERKVVAAAGGGCESRGVIAAKAAAEIRTHEVVRPVGSGAGDREHGQAEQRELAAEARLVEGRVHGVAGARVGEAQIEERRGRERGAGARKRDARGGQLAQLRPRLILRRRGRYVCGRAVLGHEQCSRRQQRAEAAGHDARANARGSVDEALALEPGLEFRRRAAIE